MRNSVALFLLLGVALAGPLAAQPTPSHLHADVPAAFDVAGLHLVLTEEAQRLVQQKADGLCRHQPSFQARVDLADAAFPIIDRVLKEEGVPLDFRYLALQESALLGDARSAHEAVGYWQLKRETAAGLGLVVNDDVDERQHLVASTHAAARYLARSNDALNNWLDALLSYNTGLSGVKPYTLPTDAYATQMAITGATSPYVLMFLAQKIAFEPACGLNPTPPLRLQEFPAVAGQSLETQAQNLHADPAALAVHNRWLLAPIVPVDRPYTLLVPITDPAQAAGIAANQGIQTGQELLAVPVANAANPAEVRVNDLRALVALPGETIADLARRGGQNLGDFLGDNELTAFDLAVAGRPYYLESKRDVAAVEYHVVQPGETVFDVAQKYGIRKKAIMAKNRLVPADELRPGRLLWLLHARPREVAVEYRPLPEGIALERPVGYSQRAGDGAARIETPAPVSGKRAPEAARGRPAAPRDAAGSKDGWGEALPASGAAPVAASVPVRPAAPAVAPLPPPAAAPAPAPLADEPRRPAPDVEPVTTRPAAMPKAAGATPVAPAAPRLVMAPKPSAPAPVAAAAPAATGATHLVEPGETVYSISRRFQIAPATLMALNNLTPASGLVVGQLVALNSQAPLPGSPVAAAGSAPAARPAGSTNPALYVPKAVAGPATQHTVVEGETLYSIARRYGVAVADLQAWNAKLDVAVRLGEVLRVQADAK